MKLFYYLISTFFIFSNFIYSQTHQVYGSFGYNFPTATAVIGSKVVNESLGLNLSTFSEGLVFQGGYLLGINNNFSLDLNINYLSGVKEEVYTSDNTNGDYFKYSNSNISISPSLNVKFSVGKFSPYTKFGVSFNFIDIKKNIKTSVRIGERQYEYKNDFTFGFVAGIGLNYDFYSNFIVFTECQLNSITFYPDEVRYTDTETNTTVTLSAKEKINTNNSNESITLVEDFPFSSIGVIIGFRIVL